MDDTSMAFCLAESLIETRIFEPGDQLKRYLRWYRTGYLRIGVDERLDHLHIDLVADVAVDLEGNHFLEARALRNRDRRGEIVGVSVFVGDVLDEQHNRT